MSENPPFAAQTAADAVARSNRADVRNPMIAIPEVQAFLDLPQESQQGLRDALLAVSRACRDRSKESWRTRRPVQAAYWYANAVNSAHLARAIPRRPGLEGGGPPGVWRTAASALTFGSRALERNPLIAIPEVQAFLYLPADAQQALRAALLAFSRVARDRSKKSWATRKAPLASYWFANAVNSAHLARAIPCREELVEAQAPRVERQRGG